MMNDEYQSMAANAIAHAALMVQSSWQEAGWEHASPCVLFKPRICIDGNKWCALYGENLQDGVAGFGDSPDLAMRDFDKAWGASQLLGVQR